MARRHGAEAASTAFLQLLTHALQCEPDEQQRGVPVVDRRSHARKVEDFAGMGRRQRRIADTQKALKEEQQRAEEKAAVERRQTLLSMADELEASVKSAVDKVAEGSAAMQVSAQQLTATAEQTTAQSSSVAAASAARN